MAELLLQVGDDHVRRLAHENDPVRAIVELIWNSVDAEASRVDVEIEGDEWDTIAKVTGTTGTASTSTSWSRPSGPWRLVEGGHTQHEERQACLHGEKGEGRHRVFALGSRVQWLSHSDDASHGPETVGGFRRSLGKLRCLDRGLTPCWAGSKVMVQSTSRTGDS